MRSILAALFAVALVSCSTPSKEGREAQIREEIRKGLLWHSELLRLLKKDELTHQETTTYVAYNAEFCSWRYEFIETHGLKAWDRFVKEAKRTHGNAYDGAETLIKSYH